MNQTSTSELQKTPAEKNAWKLTEADTAKTGRVRFNFLLFPNLSKISTIQEKIALKCRSREQATSVRKEGNTFLS